MKHLLITALFFAFISCNSGNQQLGNEDHEGHTDGEKAETAENTSKDNASGIVLSDQDIEKFREVSSGVADQLVDTYLSIKDALVNTNGQEAKKAAEKMHQSLESYDGEAISQIREDIEHIARTESVEHQREHFNDLSKSIYAMIKATDHGDMTLYRQYCPMAFNNTGAFWLSSSEEIRNPYFGDKMLKCGKVEETIN